MDFTKYVALLNSGGLHFARGDKLGDPFEGSTNQLAQVSFAEQLRSAGIHNVDRLPDDVLKNNRLSTYVNCWHMSDHESVAMWKIYGLRNDAIAVQSSYAKLRDSLPESVYLSAIRYIDYTTTPVYFGNFMNPIVHKRVSFAYEKEVRAFLTPPGIYDEENYRDGQFLRQPPVSHHIEVDLSNLVDRIYISPDAPVWLEDLVSAITMKLGFGFSIHRSDLSTDPVF